MKKLKNLAIGYIIGVVLALIAALGLSWIATCGVVKLITLCFGVSFSWAKATGVWLALWLLGTICGGSKK